MIKNKSKHTSILPDVAEIEPISTVGLYLVLVCWLLIQTDLVSITYLHFFVFKEFKAFFFKSRSLQHQNHLHFNLFLASSEFCCTWLTCGRQFTKSIYYHVRKQKKLYVKQQYSKKYWILILEIWKTSLFLVETLWQVNFWRHFTSYS